ncbi:MAG: DNA protecting protein DprA [Spirochaetaceae bacterium 4572_59]|nr:MAG: DNA protecting protein DprA [Spirochaetaceae bacterium 4572_59]
MKTNQIDIFSEEYPDSLRQIADPPRILYYRGEWNPEIFEQTISVVGSRKMTRYGRFMTESLVTEIAEAGITVLSGFMYGIDATSHKAAVDAEGKTIAVMPCGIERIHPLYQKGLYEEIIHGGGLILSEYEADSQPALWTYPRRNRIVVGLSPLLLVMEAGLKSGALMTARIARRYNKKIYALPGPLSSTVSLGCALLIKQGASIVTGSQDILLEYGLLPCEPKQNGTGKRKKMLSSLQKSIIEQLEREAMSVDEMTRVLGKSASQIGAELTLLTLQKRLSFQEGRYSLC